VKASTELRYINTERMADKTNPEGNQNCSQINQAQTQTRVHLTRVNFS